MPVALPSTHETVVQLVNDDVGRFLPKLDAAPQLLKPNLLAYGHGLLRARTRALDHVGFLTCTQARALQITFSTVTVDLLATSAHHRRP
jgi:hypothetical protein